MEFQSPVTASNGGNKRVCVHLSHWRPSLSREVGIGDGGSNNAEYGDLAGDGQDPMDVDHAPPIDLSGYEQPLRLRGGYGEDSSATQLHLENAQMGAALSKEDQAELRQPLKPHELLNETLQPSPARNQHVPQADAERASVAERVPRRAGLRPGKLPQSSIAPTSTNTASALDAKSKGQLQRPRHLYEDIPKAQSSKAETRGNDIYAIAPTPKKSNKASNARLPAGLARKKAAFMPGSGASQVDLDDEGGGDEEEPLPLAVEDPAELELEQEAPTSSVTRITPKKAAKITTQEPQTDSNDSFAFRRSSKPKENKTRSQSGGRTLRNRGDVVELVAVDWGRKPEHVARKRLDNTASTEIAPLTARTNPLGSSSTQRGAGELRASSNGPQHEAEPLQPSGTHWKEDRTMIPKAPLKAQPASAIYNREQVRNMRAKHPMRSTAFINLKLRPKRWSTLNEAQRRPYEAKASRDRERYEAEMASYHLSHGTEAPAESASPEEDEPIDMNHSDYDSPDEEVPTSAQPENDRSSSPLEKVLGDEEDQLQSGEQSHSSPSVGEEENLEPEDEEQSEAEIEDERKDEDDDRSSSSESSDGESNGTVSSMDVAVEGLFGQAENIITIRKALKRVGIQTNKDRLIKHKIKLRTMTIKKIVRLTTEAIELRREINAAGSGAPNDEYERLNMESRRRVGEIQNDVHRINEEEIGDEREPMIKEIYAHGLPKLVLFLLEQVRSHAHASHVETRLLKNDIKLINIILELNDKASNWKPRPDSQLTIVKPITNGVIPPLRSLRLAFYEELSKRRENAEKARKQTERTRARLEQEQEDRIQAEQFKIDLDRERKQRSLTADQEYRRTDPHTNYHKSRNQPPSSQTNSSIPDSIRQTTPLDKSIWTEEEKFTLLEGLMRFSEPEDRYQKILHAYGNARVPLSDRNLSGENNGIINKDRRLANRSLDEIIERARELKEDFTELVSRRSRVDEDPESLPDWVLSI
ncbi:MAG: hypothetical protein M1812_003918 [Candelaria pacifica]|nr:MAG: hypothetical protein M1812_003918 [Candelaria pacifica]